MHTLQASRAHVILSQYTAFDDGFKDFQRLPAGMFNENASFVAQGRKYVLKKLPGGRSLERHTYALRWQNHLAREGFPCPTFLPNRDGDLVTTCEGQLWTVQTWAHGGPLDLSALEGSQAREIMLEVGTTLGRLHRMGREARQSGAVPPAGRSCRITLSEMIDGCRATLQYLLSPRWWRPSRASLLRWKPFKSPAEKEILLMLATAKNAFAELDGWDPTPLEEKNHPIPCHGDINWDNFLFQENRLTAVLDFDNALEMPAVYEVAAAAAVVCRPDVPLRRWFLEGYTQEAEWSVDEEDMRLLMLLKCFKSLLFQIETALNGGTKNEQVAREWRLYLTEKIRVYSAR